MGQFAAMLVLILTICQLGNSGKSFFSNSFTVSITGKACLAQDGQDRQTGHTYGPMHRSS